MVAREYTRGARNAGHPGAPINEETHPRPEPTPEPNAVRAVPEPATERLAVVGERSGPPSPSLPYQEMALVHQNQNQNPGLDHPRTSACLTPRTGTSWADKAAGAAAPRTGESRDKWRADGPDWIILGRTRRSGHKPSAGSSREMRPAAVDMVAVVLQRSGEEDEAQERQSNHDEDGVVVMQVCIQVDEAVVMWSRSQEDLAVAKQ